ncbi:GFA family protein [Sphingomonas sp. LB-2]|uniref:GFA family protein n=1 Tax=Sphingomonas caeni TaxID=2984949 RepID=UPI00222EA420|nr:GFA family protein [Sphingomonas caeni]MCW3849257.1 GFA family protein [Sphingomonas caeni]
MTTRKAECRCGAATAVCEGEPVRVSVCHCLHCQRRSGSAFAVQARWPEAQVTIAGETREWTRVNDSGSSATFRFCAACGSDIAYVLDSQPGLIAVPVGAFADPGFTPWPEYSVYEGRKHGWVEIAGEGIEHYG